MERPVMPMSLTRGVRYLSPPVLMLAARDCACACFSDWTLSLKGCPPGSQDTERPRRTCGHLSDCSSNENGVPLFPPLKQTGAVVRTARHQGGASGFQSTDLPLI